MKVFNILSITVVLLSVYSEAIKMKTSFCKIGNKLILEGPLLEIDFFQIRNFISNQFRN